jgi:hypothetical protein
MSNDQVCGCGSRKCKQAVLYAHRLEATAKAEAWQAEHGSENKDLEQYADLVFFAYLAENDTCDKRLAAAEHKRMAPVKLDRTRAVFDRDVAIGIKQVRAKHAQRIAALDN